MFWACYGCQGYVLQFYSEFIASNYIYNSKYIIQNNYYFNKFFQKNENVEEDVPLISMLHNKIKLEIDINNDELLEIIWEHMRELERGEQRGSGEEIY